MKTRLIFIIVIVASSPAYAGRSSPKTLVFDVLLGMPIVTVKTSEGTRRFVLDTGSSISTMDIRAQRLLSVKIAGKECVVLFRPTQTQVFHEFEELLPPSQHVDGILGSDFMKNFRHVAFNFKDHLVTFE